MVRMRLSATATFALAPPPADIVEFTAEDMESDDSMWAVYDSTSAGSHTKRWNWRQYYGKAICDFGSLDLFFFFTFTNILWK